MANAAERVYSLIEETVKQQGVTLWDVRFLKEGANWYLRVFIDSENGIGIDDCTNVSHAIDPIIDEADPIDKAYYLEVCSPGLNRELTKDEHFELMAGKDVIVHTIRAEDGTRDIKGKLISRDKEDVKVLLDEQEITIKRTNISSVKLDDIM